MFTINVVTDRPFSHKGRVFHAATVVLKQNGQIACRLHSCMHEDPAIVADDCALLARAMAAGVKAAGGEIAIDIDAFRIARQLQIEAA